MPRPTTPSGSPSSSKRMLALVGGVLALVAVIWLAVGRGDQASRDGSNEAKPLAPATDRPRTPSAKAIELAPTRASGQVRATTGEPLAGAVVTLASFDQDAGEPQTVQTNSEGAWSMTGLAAGRYALSASAEGYLASVRSEVALRAGNDHAGLDLSLEPGGNTLSGVVSDKTGGVVEGALVQVTPQSGILRLRERDSYFTLSDDRGRYAVQVPDGRHRVRASHVDYTAESRVLEFAGQARAQNFTLVPTAVLEGVVLRESDASPVAGAEVSWSRERTTFLPDGGRISTIDRGGRVVADESGRFRISGLSPGLVLLGGRASLLASVDPMQIPVGIAERVTGVELRLADAGDLEGRVVAAADGAGIEGAQVELMSRMNGGAGAGARTDARGQFVIRGVLPGEYGVMASAEGWTSGDDAMARVEIGGQPTSVVIELERGLSIRGRVEPAGQAEVAIELRPESMPMRGGGMIMLSGAGPTQAAADTGAFEIGPVQPGRYTLEARTPDGRGGTVEVEVGADGADDVVINLAQRGILAGRVEDFTGKLLDDVTVRARKRRGDGGSLSVVVNGQELTALSSPTSSDGRFELAGLAAGTWAIEVVDAQGDLLPLESGQPLELALADGDNEDIVLRVEPRDGTISGVVHDAEGQPVADAWVSAAFVPEPKQAPRGEGDGHEVRAEMRMMMITDDGAGAASTLPPVLTDDAGKFVFTQLRRGSYSLTAELGGGVSKATLEGVRPNADVTLELAPLGAIEGSVISNGGPASCMAKIMGPSPRNVRVREGKFEVTRLEPGRYTVEVNVPDGSDSASVVVESGATAVVELALERLAKITGKVVDESGAPIAKAEVMLGSGEGGRIEITREHGDPQIFTKDDGTFEVHAAAGGRVLLVHAGGGPMPIVIKPFVVESGEDLDLGELRKQKLEGMMMKGGPEGEGGPGGEGGPEGPQGEGAP